MFQESIKSVQQAKEYFKSMGCSSFQMAREDLLRYKEYQKLNISKQMENEWRMEQLNKYYSDIMENNNDGNLLWIIHSKMCELVETFKTDIALSVILEVTQNIRDSVPFRDRVIVSETINGRKYRKCRSGLIYLAYDLNNIPAAEAFIELSHHYSTFIEQNSRDFERCRNATKLCSDIKLELGL